MSKYKICVYAISKNEETFVDRWMDAVSEADLVVVCDTGSTDSTVLKLRERGALVCEAKITPWRFDVARNLAMDAIPEDVDICVSNDLDEIFEKGWRSKLEEAWEQSCTRASYSFVWSHHPDGSVQKQFPMEKVHGRQGFRWVRPVHEVLEYSGTLPDKTVWVEGMVLHHYPDLAKPRSQYLPLLELSVAEFPQDDRGMFWLGREYVYHAQYDKAIETLQRHLELPSARWAEERSASMRLIAECCEKQGNRKDALGWLYRALAQCPEVREPYLALARFGYVQGNWQMVYAMVEKGLLITRQSGSYLMQPEAWGYALYDYGAIAAYQLGLLQQAKEYAEEACVRNPDDPRLRNNLELLSQQLSQGEGKA